MRILYLSQYFPPEVGATQTRAYEMAQGLLRAGHQVTMLAEVPNHPEGVIRPEYRGKFWVREPLDGIDVIRVWVKTAPAKTFKTRMAFYLSYMLNAMLAGLLLARGRYDALYATSPPLFVGAAALALSRLRRIPLVFEVRDLWPESAVALGELHNPRFIRWATALEEACYHRAKRIVVTSQEIFNRLKERNIPESKLKLIRNGANPALFRRNTEVRQRMRSDLNIENHLVVLYAGLFGLAYELELIVEVARQMKSNIPDIHFLLVGEGPTKPATLNTVQRLRLSNVTILPAQPRDRISDYFNAADVSLVPLKSPNIPGMLPVKIYDSMACEVPVIVAATGEPRLIVEESQAGLIIDPGNAHQLYEAIMYLRKNSELRCQYGKNGRQAVLQYYSRQAQAHQLVVLLEALQ